MRNLRILIYSPTSILVHQDQDRTLLPGAESISITLCRFLNKLGHKCKVIFDEHYSKTKIPSLAEDNPDALIISRLYYYGREINELKSIVRTRLILWVHDLPDDICNLTGLPKKSLNRIFDRYDQVIFVSESQRRLFLAECGASCQILQSSVVIHHFMDEVTAKFNAEEYGDVIHYAHPRKALHNTLLCYKLLHERCPKTKCAIVNAAPIYQLDEFDYLGRRMTLQDAITSFFGEHPSWLRILPALPNSEHRARLKRYKIYLHPDQSFETGALTCLEALESGLIPVISDIGCLPELVCDAGLIVPIGSCTSHTYFVDGILWLLSNTKIMKSLSEKAINRYQRHFLTYSTKIWDRTLRRSALPLPAPSSLPLHTVDHHLSVGSLNIVELPNLAKFGISNVAHHNAEYHIGVLEPVLVQRDFTENEVQTFLEVFNKLALNGLSTARFIVPPSASRKYSLSKFMSAIGSLPANLSSSIAYMVEFSSGRTNGFTQPRCMSAVNSCSKHLTVKQASSIGELEIFCDLYHTDGLNKNYSVLDFDTIHNNLSINGSCIIPIVLYESLSGSPCGFSLILGSNRICHLHAWGTNKTHKNAHKLLIYKTIQIAEQNGFEAIDIGAEMRHLNAFEGLSALYSLFTNTLGAYLTLTFSRPRLSECLIRYECT